MAERLRQMDAKPDVVRRRSATNANLSWVEPLILHETTRTKIVLMTYSINRTAGREVAFTVLRYSMKGGNWIENTKKRFSFPKSAALQIIEKVKAHIEIAQAPDDGTFEVIGPTDPRKTYRANLEALFNNPDAAQAILNSSVAISTSLLQDAVHIRSLREAVDELSKMLDTGTVEEGPYQLWCNAHSWAFGNAYFVNDRFRTISISDKVDMLLPLLHAGYRDIVELKRPDMEVIRYDPTHRNYYFSNDVAKAMGQTSRYIDVLHDAAGKHGLLDHAEIIANNPHATIVIGRSNDWAEDQRRALHQLNRRMNGIRILTFDQLLSQSRELLRVLSAQSTVDRAAPQLVKVVK
jgi:hypothetical protein